MGYDVHITRKENWSDEEGPSLSLESWLAYVESDPEMRLDGFAETKLPNGQTLRTEQVGLSVWVGYSGHNQDGNMAWFGFDDGSIAVKNPDEEILSKMHAIAEALEAKVQGDDGELYGSDGRIIAREPDPEAKHPWWKFWA